MPTSWLRGAFLVAVMSMALHASVGSVSMLNGVAELERSGKRVAIQIGSKIEEQDTVKTGENSKLQLTFDDQTVITLGSGSVLRVREFLASSSSPKMDLSIVKGSFRAITGKIGKIAPQNFRLETRTASIGIRGTTIDGKIGEEHDTIRCLNGSIAVSALAFPKLEPVIVTAGEYTLVPPQNIPTPPLPIPANEVSEFYGTDRNAEDADNASSTAMASGSSQDSRDSKIASKTKTGSEAQEQNSALSSNSNFETIGEAYEDDGASLRNIDINGEGRLADGRRVELKRARQKGRYIDLQYDVAGGAGGGSGRIGVLAHSFRGYRAIKEGRPLPYYMIDNLEQGIFAYGGIANGLHSPATPLDPPIPLGARRLRSLLDRDSSMVGYVKTNSAGNGTFMAIQGRGQGITKIVIGKVVNGVGGAHLDGNMVMPSTRSNDHVYGPRGSAIGNKGLTGKIYGTPNTFALFGTADPSQITSPNHTFAMANDGTTQLPTQDNGVLTLDGLATSRNSAPGGASRTYIGNKVSLGISREDPNESPRTEIQFEQHDSNGLEITHYFRQGNYKIAHINDQTFGMTNGDSWLITAPDEGGPASDYVSWGYWAAKHHTPDGTQMLLPGDINYWVAGKNNDGAGLHLRGLLPGSNQRYAYQSNSVMGSIREGASVKDIARGSVRFAFDFGGGSASLVSSDSYLRFATATGPEWNVSVNGGVVEALSGGFSATLDGGAGSAKGKFYGTEANAIGGTFNVTRGNQEATGVFKAPRI